MPLYIGTSGWQYDGWRGLFYPQDIAKRRWLEHYAERFQAVEVSNTFYRLPQRRTFEDWAERTPDDFVFVPKMSRFLTHIRRLKDAEEPVQRFFDRTEPLGRKLGPVLLQLPPNLRAEPDRLDHVLGLVPREVRVAVEPRHESWFTDELHELLKRHNAALCLADRDSKPLEPIWRTADWGYVRMHWGRGRPASCYGDAALERWAERIAELWSHRDDVYIFFNNDPNGCAVRDARRMAGAAARHGLSPSRVPEPAETRVAA